MARRRRQVPTARWERRWVAGLAVRGLISGVPFVTAVASIVVAGRLLARPHGSAVVLWYAAVCGGSWFLMWVTYRWLHRLLPLAGLLEMSLAFPERAPSRRSVARRVASRRDLEDLRAGRGAPQGESTQEAAERILALITALSLHDRATRGHSERVRAVTDLIAVRLGLSQADRERLRWAALLHDIGKLRVPTTLLNKAGRPSAREWDTLRRHPHDGQEIVAPLLPWLGPWGEVIVQHHEKWDGSGYPQGLVGDQICLGARIVAVADAYDVMTATRAYKKPMGRAAALRELVACSGRHFDPVVVRALIAVPQRQILMTLGPVSWFTGIPFLGQAPSALNATLASQTTTAAGVLALTGTVTLTPIGAAQTGQHEDRPAAAPHSTGSHGQVPTTRSVPPHASESRRGPRSTVGADDAHRPTTTAAPAHVDGVPEPAADDAHPVATPSAHDHEAESAPTRSTGPTATPDDDATPSGTAASSSGPSSTSARPRPRKPRTSPTRPSRTRTPHPTATSTGTDGGQEHGGGPGTSGDQSPPTKDGSDGSSGGHSKGH